MFLETLTGIKLWCLYLVQHMLHQIKALQFYTNHLKTDIFRKGLKHFRSRIVMCKSVFS